MPREILIIKTRNLCSGNGSQLPASSQNSECHFKQNNIFSRKTHKGNSVK